MTKVAGHPGVYRKGARYVVVWRHRGQQRKRSFRTLTSASRFKAATAVGDTTPTSRERFVDYAERWLRTYSGRTSAGLAPSTRASYDDAVRRVIVPYFKRRHPGLRLDQLGPSDLRAFIAHLASQGLAPSTCRRYFAPLRAMLATAYEDDLMARNPAAGLRVVVPDARERRPKRLTPAQTRSLLAAMPPSHADLAFVLATTGLRISEALGLVWSDFAHDEDGRPVLVVQHSKTAAGRRSVPLSTDTARRLTRRRAGVPLAGDEHPVFASSVGRPIDPCNYRRQIFKPAAKRAGVPWATPHALRHGVASLIAEQGHTAAQIAAHLGHADGGVLALRTYVRTRGLQDVGFLDDALAEPTG